MLKWTFSFLKPSFLVMFIFDTKRKKNHMKEFAKFAIVANSGKQYLLKPGEWYDIDFLKQGKIGDYYYFQKILLFKKEKNIQLGKPFLGKSEIPAKILEQVKGRKITVLKTKPKKKYTRTRGHRQKYTRVKVDIKID
jgi:large subunit ribosomal protein L21